MRIMVIDFTSLDGVGHSPGGQGEDAGGGFGHGGSSVPSLDGEAMRAGDPYADRINAIAKDVVSYRPAAA